MKEYMKNPTAYLVSERLNQLFIIYGKQYVMDNITRYYDSAIELHITNLKLFAGEIVFIKTLELMKVA